MSAIGLEAFLARLYTDSALRSSFLADPRLTCAGYDLTPVEIEALAAADRDGMILAARSIAVKRETYLRPRARSWRPWRRG